MPPSAVIALAPTSAKIVGGVRALLFFTAHFDRGSRLPVLALEGLAAQAALEPLLAGFFGNGLLGHGLALVGPAPSGACVVGARFGGLVLGRLVGHR